MITCDSAGICSALIYVFLLMDENFPGSDISIASYDNVLPAMCALHGLASEELRAEELDYQDRDYEVIVTARVVKQITM